MLACVEGSNSEKGVMVKQREYDQMKMKMKMPKLDATDADA
jgi:hypothetical protein